MVFLHSRRCSTRIVVLPTLVDIHTWTCPAAEQYTTLHWSMDFRSQYRDRSKEKNPNSRNSDLIPRYLQLRHNQCLYTLTDTSRCSYCSRVRPCTLHVQDTCRFCSRIAPPDSWYRSIREHTDTCSLVGGQCSCLRYNTVGKNTRQCRFHNGVQKNRPGRNTGCHGLEIINNFSCFITFDQRFQKSTHRAKFKYLLICWICRWQQYKAIYKFVNHF